LRTLSASVPNSSLREKRIVLLLFEFEINWARCPGQIRAMATSNDGKLLYVAEAHSLLANLDEMQATSYTTHSRIKSQACVPSNHWFAAFG
jgi:hypothetical protein